MQHTQFVYHPDNQEYNQQLIVKYLQWIYQVDKHPDEGETDD